MNTIAHNSAKASNPATCFYYYLKKRLFLKLMGCVCLGSGSLLQACNFIDSSSAGRDTMTDRSMPTALSTARAAEGKIPPIDVEQPSQLETATFAMG